MLHAAPQDDDVDFIAGLVRFERGRHVLEIGDLVAADSGYDVVGSYARLAA